MFQLFNTYYFVFCGIKVILKIAFCLFLVTYLSSYIIFNEFFLQLWKRFSSWNWKDQSYDIVTKLNRVNALLYKIRSYVSFNNLKAIYFAIFDSSINYASLIWGQNRNSKLRIITAEKKPLRIINNQSRNSYSDPS